MTKENTIPRSKGLLRSVASLCMALGLSVALCGVAAAPPLTSEAFAVTNVSGFSDRVIRVGYFPFSGYHEINADGSLSGYGYDFLQMIGAYLDGTYEYLDTDGSYSEALDMLAAGELDLVTSVSKTPAREELFLFSERPIGTNSTIFTVKAGNDKVVSENYDTYNGLVIGMIDGNSKNDVFAEFAEEKGFDYTPVYFESEAELSDALQSGEVEGAVSGSLRTINNEWVIETMNPSPFYVVTSKDNPQLMDEINEAIAQLDITTPEWRSELNREYYSVDSGGAIMLTAAERTYIESLRQSGDKLSVLFNPDRYPYSYIEDGEAKGIMPTVFNAIAENLDLPFEYVFTENQKQYYELRRQDDVDIVIDFLDNYYTAEQEGYKITKPYLITDFTRLTLAENEGNGVGDTIATVDGASNLINFVTARYPDKELLYYEDLESAIDAVRDGKADSAILYYYTVEDAIHRDLRNQLTFNMLSDATFSYSMGVNIHEPSALLTSLTKGINALGDTGINAIVDANTGTGGSHLNLSLVDFLYANPLFMALIIVGLLLLLFAIAMLVVRSRNQKRLQATVDEVSAKYEEQQDALSDALALSQQANRAKSTFLNSMSHDIRTPMNAIIGFSRLASEHIDDRTKVKDYLGKILISSDHLLSLINDVLDMSRIESGEVNIENRPEDLLGIIETISDIIETDVMNHQIEFSIQTHDIVHHFVYCDRLHLNQVLLNLLSNAIKFTPAGGTVSFSLREAPCEKIPAGESGGEDTTEDTTENSAENTAENSAENTAANLLGETYSNYIFVVSDTGIGIQPEFLSSIFDPFTRERTSTVSGTQGTGLGMAITKNILDMMGGSIEVASEVGKGTTMTVTVPLKHAPSPDQASELRESTELVDLVVEELGGIDGVSESSADAEAGGIGEGAIQGAAQGAIQGATQGTSSFSGRRLLLVEDNLFNRELALDILADADFETETAEDGTEAVEIVQQKEPGYYDAILMDIQMPIMDGYTATREIRALDGERAQVPIIALTADAFDEDRQKALDAGMNGHLSKPIEIDKLLETLREILPDE